MSAINKMGFGEHFTTPAGFASGVHNPALANADTMDSGALLLGSGNGTTQATTATADKCFMKFYTATTATSGDNRGIYWQHFLSGAGASGECARFFTKVNAAGANSAHGAHITLQIQDDATTGVSGLGAGLRATLAAEADTRTLAGTLAALQVDSDVGANNTLGAGTSFIRVADNSSVKIPNLFSIAAGSSVLAGSAANNASDALKVYIEGTGVRYIDLHDSVA